MEPIKFETGDVVKAVVTSEAHKLNIEDMKKWGRNLLVFVAPTLAVFFGLLAQGVEVNKAWPVAAFAFYQALSDLFNKWRAPSIKPTE